VGVEFVVPVVDPALQDFELVMDMPHLCVRLVACHRQFTLSCNDRDVRPIWGVDFLR
jgi:hypothetical protein